MHLTRVDKVSFNKSANSLCKQWINGYCLLNQPIKQLTPPTRCSPVKPKCEFIKIVIQAGRFHPVLISSQQPAFKQDNNTINFRQQVFTNISLISNYFMDISNFGQPMITFPAICINNTAGFNTRLNGIFQIYSRSICYLLETNTSNSVVFHLYHYNNQYFSFNSPAESPRSFSTYVDLISINSTRESITSWSYIAWRNLCNHVQTVR